MLVPASLRCRLPTLLLGHLYAFGLGACADGGPPYSILLVTLDTTRADATTPYGAPASITPSLALLAEHGVVDEAARTVAPLTQPAHASILTGLVPLRHGVRDNGVRGLPESATTLAEHARALGFQTGAFTGAVVLDKGFGFEQGFDFFDAPPRPIEQTQAGYPERSSARTAERAIGWLDGRDRDAPFFVWVHLWDAHAPYEPGPDALARAGGNPYLGEVAASDAALGELLAYLQSDGALDRTYVAVVGDHGEAFGEHEEVSHAAYAWDTTLRVPLALCDPGGYGHGTRESAPVSVADVFPTLIEAMGSWPADELDGVSLFRTSPPARAGVAFETCYGFHAYGWAPIYGWADDAGKTILVGARARRFDAHGDAREELDVASEPGDWLELARAGWLQLAALPRLAADATPRAGDDRRLQELRALGYSGALSELAVPEPFAATDLADPHERAAEQLAVQRAGGLVDSDKLDEAERELEALLAEHPANRSAWERLAQARMRRQAHREAREALRALVALGPPRADAHAQLGACELALDDARAAEAQFLRALEIDPWHAQALGGLVWVLESQGRSEECAALRARIAEIERR
jgi:arylsulfatase A-like enzyme